MLCHPEAAVLPGVTFTDMVGVAGTTTRAAAVRLRTDRCHPRQFTGLQRSSPAQPTSIPTLAGGDVPSRVFSSSYGVSPLFVTVAQMQIEHLFREGKLTNRSVACPT